MIEEQPYRLVHLPSGVDVTNLVRLDKFSDVGTGEITSAQFTIRTVEGRHITNDENGTIPIFDQYTNFRLTFTDDNNVTYTRIMVLDTMLPQKSSKGLNMQVELFGRERFLQLMKFSGSFFAVSYKDLVRRIIRFYNNNSGTSSPTLFSELNGVDMLQFPDYPIGTFDFGEDTSVYDVLLQIVQTLNLPRDAGGASDFFELLFVDRPGTDDQMVIKIMSQGSGTEHLILGESPTTREINQTKEPVAGTMVVVAGQDDTGTMPTDLARWTGMLEDYENFPQWNNTIAYETGVRVRFRELVYRCIQDTTPGIIPFSTTNWTPETLGEYLGDIQYSPWTIMKAGAIRNITSNPRGNFNSGFDSPAFVDNNTEINDVEYWRRGVDFRVASLSQINSSYFYEERSGGAVVRRELYEGFRLLLDSSLGSPEAPFRSSTGGWGTDIFGSSYENAMVQMSETGEWIVIRTPSPGPGREAIQLERFDQIAVKRTTTNSAAGVYEWDRDITEADPRVRKATTFTPDELGWRDVRNTYLGYDCFHYPTIIENVEGLERIIPRATSGNYTDMSAIRVAYEYGVTSESETLLDGIFSGGGSLGILRTLAQTVIDLLISRVTYNYGWWATMFETPYPISSRDISEDVGELYGGDIDNKVPVLDLNNRNFTPTGQSGYGASDAENLSELTGIHFRFLFDILVGSGRLPFTGDLPFTFTLEDTLSNLWTTSFTYRHLAEIQRIYLPFSSFSIYRARQPIGTRINDIIQNIITPELSIQEVFEQRKVKSMKLQLQSPYDDYGRYNPGQFDLFLQDLAAGLIGQTITTDGRWDMFGFTKTPISIARHASADTVHITPDIKQYPGISNTEQLGRVAQAELDLAQHRRDTYEIKTKGLCDIVPGDSILLEDPDLIVDTEGGVENRIKLAVRKTTYSINASEGEGGFTREISAYRRINA